MATIIGQALLAASLEVLVGKIVSGEFVNLFRSTKLDLALLEKMNITLLSLQAVLHDAEEKQITNPAVKQWLDMLRDAVFEADDLFDEINTEALRCKVEAEYETRTATAQVLKKLSSRFKSFNKKINSKLQTLFERLECLRQQNLGLKDVPNSVWHGTPTSSIVGDESAIYGRDEDKKKLKEFLLSDDGSDDGSKIGVISIVGMGGLGKTTLAKLLYNDPKVKEKFEVGGWAHISKDFDVVNVTKTLLESITSETSQANDLNTLQVQLQKSHDLPKLQLFSIGDLPISLRELSIGNVGGNLLNTTWDHLTSLSELLIRGDDIVKVLIKTENPLLPASLVSLMISFLEDIECLDGKWLHHLNFLQHFEILDAPKLKSLPKKGKLPSSLKVLNIKKCPLLKASLLRKRGKGWRKIAHIPCILINNEMIT